MAVVQTEWRQRRRASSRAPWNGREATCAGVTVRPLATVLGAQDPGGNGRKGSPFPRSCDP